MRHRKPKTCLIIAGGNEKSTVWKSVYDPANHDEHVGPDFCFSEQKINGDVRKTSVRDRKTLQYKKGY